MLQCATPDTLASTPTCAAAAGVTSTVATAAAGLAGSKPMRIPASAASSQPASAARGGIRNPANATNDPPPASTTSPNSATSGADPVSDIHQSFIGSTLVMQTRPPLLAGRANTAATLVNATTESAKHLQQAPAAGPLPPLETDHQCTSHISAFRIDSVIGSGSFSYVYLAHDVETPFDKAAVAVAATASQDLSGTGAIASALSPHSDGGTACDAGSGAPIVRRAVKRLFKDGLDAKQLELQKQEITIMKALCDHECIVPLLGTVEDAQCLYLVMEYCEMDLYDAITKRGGFSDSAVKKIFGQIVDAVIHCHSKGFYHRDLKPENCLIVSSSSSPTDYKIKVTDFGLATSDTWSTEMGCGSVRYMAPECFDPLYVSTNPNIRTKDKKQSTTPNSMSSRNGYPPASSDVWSLGVILVNLLFAKNPWFEAHPTDPIFSSFISMNPNILRQQFNLSPHFDALLRRCFDLDPRRRCSVHDMKVLVETMPRFVGGCVPGLIVPWGPNRATSNNDLGITKSNKTPKITGPNLQSNPNQKQYPGLVLAPGVPLPHEFDDEQLRLILGRGSKLVIPSASLTNASVNSMVAESANEKTESWISDDSVLVASGVGISVGAKSISNNFSVNPRRKSTPDTQLHPSTSNPPYPFQAHQPKSQHANLVSPSTVGQFHNRQTEQSSLSTPQSDYAIKSGNLSRNSEEIDLQSDSTSRHENAADSLTRHANRHTQNLHQTQHQHQKTPSVSIRFPSLRRRLSASISGIRGKVKDFFAAARGTVDQAKEEITEHAQAWNNDDASRYPLAQQTATARIPGQNAGQIGNVAYSRLGTVGQNSGSFFEKKVVAIGTANKEDGFFSFAVGRNANPNPDYVDNGARRGSWAGKRMYLVFARRPPTQVRITQAN
ncbi:hypothetical protein HDU84_002954 [Entophlyctis sp. JEL0112]|nr:hypothetical protein HDU84_002954 [Entophlyctis sp. JEL0112]